MKKNKWYWIALLGLLVVGLVLSLIGVFEMQQVEIQDGHEILKDTLRYARRETIGWWLPGIILMVGGYILTYFPLKFMKK
jgi:hypothetical protein